MECKREVRVFWNVNAYFFLQTILQIVTRPAHKVIQLAVVDVAEQLITQTLLYFSVPCARHSTARHGSRVG